MRTHAALGYDMLVDSGFSPEMLQVVRSHHEMLDGSGYPDGLRAPEIPDLVRLVTICDIYGALIERRPYRAPMPGGEAYGIVQSMTGRLDPDLVTAFLPVMFAFDRPALQQPRLISDCDGDVRFDALPTQSGRAGNHPPQSFRGACHHDGIWPRPAGPLWGANCTGAATRSGSGRGLRVRPNNRIAASKVIRRRDAAAALEPPDRRS